MATNFVVGPEQNDQIGADLESGLTLPLDWYTNPAVGDAERTRVFASSWQYIGRAADVAEAGMFVTGEIADVPIIIARDRDGSLNAMHNVCRHRAAKVIHEESGKKRTLQCHYHAWTYGLDGSLKGAPRSESEDCFPRDELGLRKASAQTWGPFLFAHLDASPPPLEEQLADLPSLAAGAGLDIDNLKFHARVEYDLNCNWKVAIENYLECYHCPTAHPGFSDVLDTNMASYQLTLGKTLAWQNGPLRPLAPNAVPRTDGYTGRDGEIPEGRYFAVFPSLKFNINPGLANLSIGPMVQAGPNATHGYLDYYFGADVSDEWIEAMLEFDNQVGAEDKDLVESVQIGIRAGSLEQGRIMLNSEKLVAGFQRWMLDRLTGEEASG